MKHDLENFIFKDTSKKQEKDLIKIAYQVI